MMTTPQERIKTLMTTLDNTSLHGIAALDEAVRSCSSFSSAQDWLNSFLKDCQTAIDSGCTIEQMANIVCGLVRNNDTGAISGLDAGSGVEKTAISIVPEDSDASAAVMPALGSTTTIDGLQVTWPTQEDLTAVISNGANASSVYFALKGLNTWWIDEAIKLGTSSYGLSFTEPDTTINVIKVNMMYDSTGDNKDSLAWVSWSYYTDTGVTADMSLNINMRFYNDLLVTDPNGCAPEYKQEYLDRTLAHEFIHALMVSNMNYVSDLPLIFKEGIAELIQGIDDVRGYAMYALANDLTKLKSALDLNASIPYEKYYAAGYMALRYLAKKDSIAPFVPNTAAWYDNNNTTLVVKAGSACLDGSEGTQYLSTVAALDASGSITSKNVLVGNSNDNMIIAGSGTSSLWGGGSSSDTLQGGSGSDTFRYGSSDGKDTIKSMSDASDHLYLYNTSTFLSIGRSESDSRKIVMTLDAADSLTIIDAGELVSDTAYSYTLDGTTDYQFKVAAYTANTLTFDDGVEDYYGSTSTAADHATTLKVTGSTDADVYLDGRAGHLFANNITNIDASSSTGAVTLAGGTRADAIEAGYGSASLWGGAGAANDTMTGGSGHDLFWYGQGEGNDLIRQMSSDDCIDFYNIKPIVSVARDSVYRAKIVITEDAADTLTIQDTTDSDIAYNYTLDGSTQYQFKAAAYTADTLTFANDVEDYYGSSSTAADHTTTLKVTGSADADVYLDGRAGHLFANNIARIDAASSTGTVTLAGGTQADFIAAGSGSASLWGGAGAVSDTLQGGSGKDVFWYGADEGDDTITGGSSEDMVLLYAPYGDTFSYQSATLTNSNLVLNMNSGTLTIQGWSESSLNTFATADGSKYKFVQSSTPGTVRCVSL